MNRRQRGRRQQGSLNSVLLVVCVVAYLGGECYFSRGLQPVACFQIFKTRPNGWEMGVDFFRAIQREREKSSAPGGSDRARWI